MDAIEETAANFVVAELNAVRWEERDVKGHGRSIRDYDTVFDDGHEEPLEVTTNADANVLTTMARMQGRDRIAANVTRSWWVTAPYTTTGATSSHRPFFGFGTPSTLDSPRMSISSRARLVAAMSNPYSPTRGGHDAE